LSPLVNTQQFLIGRSNFYVHVTGKLPSVRAKQITG